MKVAKMFLAGAMLLAGASAAHGSVFITEYMYNGLGVSSVGEYVELLNTGPVPVDFSAGTGWSFDDSSHTPGSFSLSGLGMLGVGQQAIITDVSAATFIANWGLPADAKVIGGNDQNLGRSDAINIYDGTSALVDTLTYNDQGTGTVAGPRANNVSANILPANYGANNASLTVLSTVGDSFGSYASGLGEIGNPIVTPEPASLGLIAGAGVLLLRRRRGM